MAPPSSDPGASAPVDKDYYNPKARPLPQDPTLRGHVEAVLRDGYVVIPNAFAEIDRLHGADPLTGATPFDGHRTNRVLSLLGKTRARSTASACSRPALALNDHFLDPDYPLLHRRVLHPDDGVVRLPRPRPPTPVTAATMIVLDDYTESNGATRLIPCSHLGRATPPPYSTASPTSGPSRTSWSGSTRGGSCRGEIQKRIADMMGYRSAAPFVGYVDGMNPRKAAKRLVR
ncbi:hypothetical protein LY76DRAFT_647911 [Colletotrichum caudatum]|nr:hypothetical protein LY76DRAFT_647911 [Colletotrichum caudatum]